ncbi:hypothetical protein PVAG01_04949 [Phlyctema vagabunda]|uniref:Uncharacterized protein n=1 Tax=Phlyctema vagabunda TaxID=108571 RepID=A0ABR4PJE7_9HELO
MAHTRNSGPHSSGGLSNFSGHQPASIVQPSQGMPLPVGVGTALNGLQLVPQNTGTGMGIFSNPWAMHGLGGPPRAAAAIASSNEPPPQRASEKKDVCVRGVYYGVRRSYMAENAQFEEKLVRYMDTKRESEVPDFMVDMLIKCVNDDSYTCTNILDDVTLYLLASSVGAASVKETAAAHIQAFDLATTRVWPEDLIMVTVTVLCSDKTDDLLREWLKNLLSSDPAVAAFVDGCLRSPGMCLERPEAVVAYERLVNPNRFPSLISWRLP